MMGKWERDKQCGSCTVEEEKAVRSTQMLVAGASRKGCCQGPYLDLWPYCIQGPVDVCGFCYHPESGLPPAAMLVSEGCTAQGSFRFQ